MTDSSRYRVWCLSWEDDEEHGGDVVGVSADDVQSIPRGAIQVSRFLLDAESAAEEYAEWVYFNRDGWEDTWPLKFRVRSPDGTTADFEVSLDYSPEFSARGIKEDRR